MTRESPEMSGPAWYFAMAALFAAICILAAASSFVLLDPEFADVIAIPLLSARYVLLIPAVAGYCLALRWAAARGVRRLRLFAVAGSVVLAVASYVIDLAAAIPIGVTGHAIFVGAPLLLFGLTVVLPRLRSPRPTLDRFRPWLAAAAVYNGVWGIGALALAPDLGWKVVGLVVLAYAPGYWWASRFPDRHPHLVAVGLFGKTLGPLAYGVGAATGRASDALLLVIVTNDLVWWPAFAAYLRAAAHVHGGWRAFLNGA